MGTSQKLGQKTIDQLLDVKIGAGFIVHRIKKPPWVMIAMMTIMH